MARAGSSHVRNGSGAEQKGPYGPPDSAYLLRRLVLVSTDIRDCEQLLAEKKAERDHLIVMLAADGYSEREIASVADVSAVRVHQIKEAHRG